MEELEIELLHFLATTAGQGERPSLKLSMLKKNALVPGARLSLLCLLPPWKSNKEEARRLLASVRCRTSSRAPTPDLIGGDPKAQHARLRELLPPEPCSESHQA
jgi:hypothetical protein